MDYGIDFKHNSVFNVMDRKIVGERYGLKMPPLSDEELLAAIAEWKSAITFPMISLNNLYFFRQNGLYTERTHMPCLGSLRNNNYNVRFFFFTTNTETNVKQHEAEEYLDFMFNHSVYKDIYLTDDPTSVYKGRGILIDTPFPPHYVFSGCQAIRYIWDKQYIIHSFLKMKNHCDPYDAWFLAHFFTIDTNGNFSQFRPDGYHSNFHRDRMNSSTFPNYKAKTFSKYGMSLNKKLFNENTDYIHGNYLFTEHNEKGLKNFRFLSTGEQTEMDKRNPFIRPLPDIKDPVKAFIVANELPIEWSA